MDLDINVNPSVKLIKIIDETVTVVLGTTTTKKWTCPSHKLVSIRLIVVKMSQTLQTIAIGDIKVDNEPITGVAFTSSTTERYLDWIGSWQTYSLGAQGSFPVEIPMRESLEILFTSTAVGNGTALVQVWGYVIDDDKLKYKATSTMGKLLSV